LRRRRRNKVVDAAVLLATQLSHMPGVFQGKQMSNPMQMWNDWLALSLQTAKLSWEAQGVMALRVMRMAAQPAHSQTEAHRMVTEKAAALGEAQGAAVTASITGGKSHRVAKKVLGVYKKRVRANRRRLTRT
jgi:hypothetical protein